MKKLIIAIAILLTVAACTEHKSINGHDKKISENYPKIIDSLGLEKLYDDTKWNLYLIHCDDIPTTGRYDSLIFHDSIYFASLDLRFDSLQVTGDTTILYFDYFKGDTLVSCITFREISNFYLIHGVSYTKGNDTSACLVFNCMDGVSKMCNFLTTDKNDTSGGRFSKPLKPDVVQFINKHKSMLHPWFYREAVKRGVLKS